VSAPSPRTAIARLAMGILLFTNTITLCGLVGADSPESRIYVTGGFGPEGSVASISSAVFYWSSNGSVVVAPSLIQSRGGHATVAVQRQSRVYSIGGMYGSNANLLATFEYLDLSTSLSSSWVQAANQLTVGRWRHAAAYAPSRGQLPIIL
jgi:hypothetical protein